MKRVSIPRALLLGYALLVTMMLVTRLALGGSLIGSDGLAYYAPLRSAAIDGDLHYENEFRDFNPLGHAIPSPDLRTATDHVPNKYTLGPALLWLPFFALAHALTLLLGSATWPPDGYSTPYQLAVGLGSMTYAVVGIALIYLVVRRFYARNHALLGTAAVVLGTNVSYYLVIEPSMSHATSLFAVSLFIWLWLEDRDLRGLGGSLLLGAAAGLMTLVRPQNILFLLPLVFEWSGWLKPERQRRTPFPRRAAEVACFCGGALLVSIPQLVAWKIVYGEYLLYAYQGEGFDLLHPKLLETLFSARHGLLSWTPILFAALVGLPFFVRRHRRLALALALPIVLQWYSISSWHTWWFGHAFSGRAFMGSSYIFVLGTTAALAVTQHWGSIALRIALGIAVIWNLLFTAQYGLGMVPHGDAVDWRAVAIGQFEVIERGWQEISDRL